MDLGLSSKFRFNRMHRQAVALHPAVATALADRLVDEDAHFWIGQAPALPEPPLLGGAPLVVHERGDARNIAQQPLSLVEPVAVPYLDTRGPRGALRILVGSSVITMMRLTPSAAIERVSSGTGIAPAASW